MYAAKHLNALDNINIFYLNIYLVLTSVYNKSYFTRIFCYIFQNTWLRLSSHIDDISACRALKETKRMKTTTSSVQFSSFA